MGEILYIRDPELPRPSALDNVVTLWYDGDDGFLHRRNGRFHHRRNPALIARVLSAIEMRHLHNDEVRYD